MNGVPNTLAPDPANPTALNKAGSNTNTNYTNALNYYGLKSGSIGDPSPSTISSASQFNPANPNQNSDDHPVLSANGSYVSSSTGQPWHGSYQNPNGTTQYYSNGQQVSDIGQVGLQQPQIGVQQLQKDPALSSQVSGAVSQNATNTNLLSKPFSAYLAEAQNIGAAAPAQLTAAEAAINPSGTVKAINSTVADTGSQLNNTLNNLTAEQQQNQQNIAAANQNYQTTQNQNLTNLGSSLTTENQNYATAAQNVAAQAYANALKQTNLYQLQSGTPSSGSGQLSNRYIADYNAVNLPLQADLANRAIATTNQLYGLGSNLQNQYLANLQNQYAGQGALNQSLASQGTANTQYMAGLRTNAAQYIQSLQEQVATMTPQLAMSYLQSIGMPVQTAQALISGNTANLSQLVGLDQAANAYNFYGNYQPQAPSFLSPRVSLPYTAPTSTGSSGGFGNVAASLDAQMNQLGSAQQSWLQTPQGQAWLQQNNTGTSQPNNYGGAPAATGAYNPALSYSE